MLKESAMVIPAFMERRYIGKTVARRSTATAELILRQRRDKRGLLRMTDLGFEIFRSFGKFREFRLPSVIPSNSATVIDRRYIGL